MEKLLWIDFETVSVDPNVASVLEVSYIPEINGVAQGETRSFFVQPIIHTVDQVYGHLPIEQHIEVYNRTAYPARKFENQMVGFSFDGESSPLFTYARSNLTYGLAPGVAPRDPSLWLTDPSREFPEVVLDQIIEDLAQYRNPAVEEWKDKWVLAGYNISYDLQVLKSWIARLHGDGYGGKFYRDKFDFWFSMDVYSLVRWFDYHKPGGLVNKKLGTVASALGFDLDAHIAKNDIETTRKIAKQLLEMANVSFGENAGIPSSQVSPENA